MAETAMETSSDEEPSLDTLNELPQRRGLHHTSSDEDDTPSTKRHIKSLLKDICSLFQADLAIVREDAHSLTGRVKLTEEEVTALQTKQTAMQETPDKTIQAQEGMAGKLADKEDKNRRNNIKLRGMPENVAMAKLLQYLLHLFHHLLPPKRAKAIILNGCYHIPKPPNGQKSSTRDLIVQLVSSLDKMAVLVPVSGLISMQI
ncbi:Hypothetical predicted protein [Pelobates cultripes]|uniref:Uncharacterized protein n=1 Tax=Pelobates cultripes TaxID=61616 RepID=A0AAD1SQ89_PELCU|nr:Hypothetical predicted protein [Pelobates cultripes]